MTETPATMPDLRHPELGDHPSYLAYTSSDLPALVQGTVQGSDRRPRQLSTP